MTIILVAVNELVSVPLVGFYINGKDVFTRENPASIGNFILNRTELWVSEQVFWLKLPQIAYVLRL